MVWTMLRSGLRTRQTSFTPSAQICGFAPSRPKWSIAAPVRESLRALGEHREARNDVVARLEGRERLPVAPAPAVTRAHSAHATVLDEELRRGGLGQDDDAERLRLLGQEAAELGDRDDEVAVVPHRRRGGIRNEDRRVST